MENEIFGLIGHPLGHSFSLSYFKEKFKSMPYRNLSYHNFDFGDLPSGIRFLKSCEGLRGLNVTLPYKRTIIPYLDGLSQEARAVAAVNTVCIAPDGRWTGHNTDIVGFAGSLQAMLSHHRRNLEKKALVVGNGGASQAVQYVFARWGLPYDLLCRSGHEPRAGMPDSPLFQPARVWQYGQIEAGYLAREISIVVNTTCLGMYPDTGGCPMMPYEGLGPEHSAFDLVYNPEETLFMKHCARNGALVSNGLDMLHRQAEASWSLWNGEIPAANREMLGMAPGFDYLCPL